MAGGSRTLVVGLFVFAVVAAACDLPSLQEARQNAVALPQTSAIYSADGRLITRLHAGENRIVVGSRKIPDVMRNAVIAIEDKRFYDHRAAGQAALRRQRAVDHAQGPRSVPGVAAREEADEGPDPDPVSEHGVL